MRRILPLALALAAIGGAANAMPGPPQVQITISPKLEKLAHEKYGVRDVEALAAELKRDVERELARTGALSDGRVELVLIDAKPSRPTFKQLGDIPGLSYESFSLGGAKIEGRLVAADGAVTDVSYSRYETDITQAPYRTTWGDAHWTFDRFARRLSRGEALAQR